MSVTELKTGNSNARNIVPSEALGDVKYEIRGQLANRAHELEKRGYEIISLNIGNPGLFGFRTPCRTVHPWLGYRIVSKKFR